MADENTQTAPVAGAEESNATQENKGVTYYFSDPDSANAEMHHVVITLPYELPELPWHWHTEKPDDSLKDPVWDLKVNGWVENSKDGQAAILQEATQKIEELDKKNAALDQANDKFDKAMKTMQTAQQNNTEQNEMLTKGMAALMKSQKDNNKLMMSMQKVMENLAKQNKDVTTPEAPATDTSTQSTNKQENGGN